jgi:flavin reductase (DIM6/NTAB) family NADH-FMN oxidoreductase RutF
MNLDFNTLDKRTISKLLLACVAPRPIALVSSISAAGVVNAAAFSFFNAMSYDPPIIVLGVAPQPSTGGAPLAKDTAANIRDTGEFVVNMATLAHAHQLHRSAFEFASEVDEFVAVGLEKEPSVAVRPPRVKGAPIAIECKLDRIIPIGDLGDHVVFGEVLRFHVRDDIYLDGGRIDTAAVQAVGRLAAEYTLVHNAFTTPLEPDLLASFHGQRVGRLDGKADGYSPIDTKEWSASGATRT